MIGVMHKVSLHSTDFRNTTQRLLPPEHEPPANGGYDIHPPHDIGEGAIQLGFEELARRIAGEERVIIDGFVGTFWEDFRERLEAALSALGASFRWVDVSTAMLPPDRIDALCRPFLGGDDPIFGRRYPGRLADFFDGGRLEALAAGEGDGPVIIHGCGAALTGAKGLLVYIDLPKNELQFRSRAGAARNLGCKDAAPPREQYKRYYFIDWVVLNRHRAEIVGAVDVLVDGQRPDSPAFIEGDAWRGELARLSKSSFRARPWFEPGPWGGEWIGEKISGLSPDVPNYAWSFELISPENGLLLRDKGRLLEFSFDWLMAAHAPDVLGACFDRFGVEFPIRFDFLDTVGGGNLSVQCHPGPAYIRENFGENFTQDETYYILDCTPGAKVYLGFNEGVDPEAFHDDLRRSHDDGEPMDVERHVQTFTAEKHGLYLIPNGTIHCSGIGNLVLEISATPYIFTFKMYDWMRLDLDGKPRPLNIGRAMDNLCFERQGKRVEEELISRPRVVVESGGGRLVHLPTHPDHFFDVHRFEFNTEMEAATEGSPHVMSLVEGRRVVLETRDGTRREFHYAETFVVPAAARGYRLISPDGEDLMVVKAFVKEEARGAS